MSLKDTLEKIRAGEIELPEDGSQDFPDKWNPSAKGDRITGLVLAVDEEFATEFGVSMLITIDTTAVNGLTGEKGSAIQAGQRVPEGVYSFYQKLNKGPAIQKEQFDALKKAGALPAPHFTYTKLVQALVKADMDFEPGVWLEIDLTGRGDLGADGNEDMRAKFLDYKVSAYADAPGVAAAPAAAEPATDKARARRAALVGRATGDTAA